MRKFNLAISLVALLNVVGCSEPSMSAKTEQSLPQKPEEGVVRIPDASRQYIEVQEVSGTRTDAAISAPARVDFREGAVSQIGAPLDGRVVEVHVRVGQSVAPGDALVTLDCPEAAGMRSSVESANAALREAKAELERQQRMKQEGVGIDRDRIAAETRVSAAEADVARIAAGAQFVGEGRAAAVVVRSPVRGVVITRKANVGMAATRGGDALIEVGDPTALWVVADVFEQDLPHVRVGAGTRVDIPAAHGDLIGRVTSVGSIVVSTLRTAPVRVTLDLRGAALKPGMSGRARIDSSDSGITLPVEAVLIKDAKDPVVYVQKDPLTYLRRAVVVGQSIDGRVQIVSGVSAGDKVVVRGALLLDGSADQLL